MTIRDYENGKQKALSCQGGCIALICTAVSVVLVCAGGIGYKKFVVDKQPAEGAKGGGEEMQVRI